MHFSDFGLHPSLVEQLSLLNLQEPTKVQAASLPRALSGADLLVQAQTGSGKTFAFILPLLQKYLVENVQGAQESRKRVVKSLILCPTRELSGQVSDQCRLLAKLIPNYKVLQLTGGVALAPQLASLKSAPQVIIGTPGRVLDVFKRTQLPLSQIDILVLDEADRMLDMGFAEQMNDIFHLLKAAKANPQNMLFSATISWQVNKLANQLFNEPEFIRCESEESQSQIEQQAWQVLPNKTNYAVAALLTKYQPTSCIVFCNTKAQASELYQSLRDATFNVGILHGDMPQDSRDISTRAFKAYCNNVLVATDVAARGLDIDNVELVICASVSADIDTHVHRVGRTGRAGNPGLAVTLFADNQSNHIDKIADVTKKRISKHKMQALRFHKNRIVQAQFKGLSINAGKKQKIGKVDIVGVLTKQGGIAAEDIGKIFISTQSSFVALKLRSIKPAFKCLRENKIKGKRVSIKTI